MRTKCLLVLMAAFGWVGAAHAQAPAPRNPAPAPRMAAPAPAAPTAPTSDACATKSPVVLATGLFSVPFFNVAESLRACGAQVFLTTVDPSNTSLVRGDQLRKGVEDILAMTGKSKAIIIAHSQGGLDSRFILGMKPELLSAIIQAGTPNTGSDSANIGVTLGVQTVVATLGQGLTALGGMVGPNAPAALQFLTSQGTATFNRMFPDGLPTQMCGTGPAMVKGVALFSFGGTTVMTNAADPSDATLALSAAAFLGQPTDGLVGRCSSHFGTVVRDDFVMNHIDLINQVSGSIGKDDPVQVYRMLMTQLKQMGL